MQVAAIWRILADCRPAVRWGGDYSERKNEMHVEIVVDELTCHTVLASLLRTIEQGDMPTPDDIATPSGGTAFATASVTSCRPSRF